MAEATGLPLPSSGMRTLHPALRVTDLAASLEFYNALGYEQIGEVDLGDSTLTMLKLPDDDFVALELVHRPAGTAVDLGTGLSHLAVQVDDLTVTVGSLLRVGLRPGPVEYPGGPEGARTSWITDPDGYRIELVQWPEGHPLGMTAADFGTP